MSTAKSPVLRFAHFQNSWQKVSFSQMVSIGSGQSYHHLQSGDIPVYGTGGYMLSVNESLSTQDAIGIGRKGTIDKPYILRAPFWTVDTLFFAIPASGFDLDYLHALSITVPWAKYDESTGVPSLSKNTIYGIEVLTPDLEEQETIGAYFRELDALIVAEVAKLEKLRALKQTMLVKMFPQGDALVPEIRFTGFEDNWGVHELASVASIVGGGTPSTTNPEYWDGEINWYSPTEIGSETYAKSSARKITELGLAKSSASLLPAHKTILFTSRASIGKVAILTEQACTNQGFQSIVTGENIDTYFLYSMCNEIAEQALRIASGSTFLEVSGKALGKIAVKLPSLKEQEAIGAYFRELDVLIEAEVAKLEKLRQLKSAFLNRMFV